MYMKNKILFIVVIIIIIFSFIFFIKKTDEDSINNLMIVAHPDDEMLWGGTELINEDYYVVCITCGIDEEREKEFESVMNKTNDEYISLGYVDKTNGERDNWELYYDSIEKDIKNILNSRKWSKIATHNPDGEYGHIHHILTSKIVTNNCDKDKLYYFNKYYTDEELNNQKVIDKELINKKENILKLYSSQSSIVSNHYDNMIREKLIPYKDWN